MAIEQAPNLWRAAVLNMGFYDPVAFFENERNLRGETSLVLRHYFGNLGMKAWTGLMSYWGDSTRQPLTQIEKISVPVFVIHGDSDRIVPLEHATQLRDALTIDECTCRDGNRTRDGPRSHSETSGMAGHLDESVCFFK